MRNNKNEKFVFIVFGIFGVAFIIAAVIMQFFQNTFSSVSDMHAPFDFMAIIFFCMGLVFIGIPLVLLISKKKKTDLIRTGTLVYADYSETTINVSYAVNGINPYIIKCRWMNPTDGHTYEFKSENLWINPEPTITNYKITKIPVYVNLDNPDKYYVDISELENKVEQPK